MIEFIIWCVICSGHQKIEAPVIKLAVIQSLAEFNDGLSTRHFVAGGLYEADPVARLFLGPSPTWQRMAPLGALEVFVSAWVGERLKHSKRFRHLWWIPQTAAILLHGTVGIRNWTIPIEH